MASFSVDRRHGRARTLALCAVSGLLSLGAIGCGESVEVTRLYSPADVARGASGKLVPVAVVHGDARTPLPPGAKIQATSVVLDRGSGLYVHKLQPNDVIETDEQGRIVAVRSGSIPPVVTRFVPGTASSPDGADDVRGQLVEPTRTIPLAAGDKIEMRGTFDPDDKVPGGGRVETTRKTSMLVGGIILTGLAFLPTAYVGASSHRTSDRVLLVPVAGPWIDFAGREKCVAPQGSQNLPVDPCIGETANRIGLVVSGIVQSFGGLLTVMALPSRTYVDYGADRGVARAPITPRWTVVPTASPYGGGASVVGAF